MAPETAPAPASAAPARPFDDFLGRAPGAAPLRRAVTAACRKPEADCVAALLPLATLPGPMAHAAQATARRLIEGLRAQPQGRGVDGLIHEYSLSSREGVALMCLAEALLRIPDKQTRDALIRDKIAGGDWRSHLGHEASLFVNAATWGLLITGKLTQAAADDSLSSALTKLIARGGEPLIRGSVDFAIRLMGERFVTGQTIEDALSNSRAMTAKGFNYSYDMLGEAAATDADARRYFESYKTAIHAIGAEAAGRGVYAASGISIKLSALHPRYSRAQFGRVMGELLPRVQALARLAKQYDIGLNIDAEEADRLELSLDLLEALSFDPQLAGWNGLGFVAQAYGKRCPQVIDCLVDLARRSGRRLMVRLVKGAYWDSEIKRAQVDGLADFPVFTRKAHTDVSYLACARKLLDAPEAIFPQFATHNAQTVAAVYHMAGDDFALGRYEFQCLHGMGEPLYGEVVEPLRRPCRIYAPVGAHETLLAYLVRRLLENGANSSFVNRIADKNVPIDELAEAPAAIVAKETPVGAPHPLIALPRDLFGAERPNSSGVDLSDDIALEALAARMRASAAAFWTAAPMLAHPRTTAGAERLARNPADLADVVGRVIDSTAQDAADAMESADADREWSDLDPIKRAEILAAAADLMTADMPELIGLIVREAGKSVPNAIAEVREAVDFLRYYAAAAAGDAAGFRGRALGPAVCVSPWNFPLAIFIGQIAAALAAGNPVVAKPAEETPLTACAGARILHRAGVPAAALQVLPGDGAVGAALVAHPAARAVMFTGSTEVARLIQRQLADRLSPEGRIIPLIAETGGQNAMIVDSSALTEQVVADVLASAFDSAGQRCSALRILCLQHDVADRTLAMLRGAMAELRVGRPDRLSADVGPVISAEARANIAGHIDAMRAQGLPVHATPLPEEAAAGHFIAPTLIELDSLTRLTREVFGPVLHVLRFRRDEMEKVIEAINAAGYGLTFGLHTRIDAHIDKAVKRVRAGNIYVNRNIIGAVVGVQPFGGCGLSGTGPKAGGPLYLYRLLAGGAPPKPPGVCAASDPAAVSFRDWLAQNGKADLAAAAARDIERSALGAHVALPGPVGESNTWSLKPRGRLLLVPRTANGLLRQVSATLAAGDTAAVEADDALWSRLDAAPPIVKARIVRARDWAAQGPFAAALLEGEGEDLLSATRRLAALDGPIVSAHAVADPLAQDYELTWLLEERTVSVNTTAAGGNASLVSIG